MNKGLVLCKKDVLKKVQLKVSEIEVNEIENIKVDIFHRFIQCVCLKAIFPFVL